MKQIFLFLLLVGLYGNSYIKYNPADLYTYAIECDNKRGKGNNPYLIVDPKNYISSKDKKEMKTYMKNIYETQKITTYCFVIDEMNSIYDSDEGIAKFTNIVCERLLKKDDKRESNSICILFSIDNRRYRISTGREVKKIWKDKDCREIVGDQKDRMRKEKYGVAFKEILKDFSENNHHYSISRTISEFWEDYWFLIILSVIVIIFLVNYFTEDTKTKDKKKLEKIQKLLKKYNEKKDSKTVLSETCAICLEPLLPGQEDIKEGELSEEEIKKKKEERKIIEEELKKNISKLQCGHQFHTDCIVNWLKRKESCPLCREKFDIDEPQKGQNFGERILNIQRTIHPTFSNYNFSFFNDDFSWSERVTESLTSNNDSSWFSGGDSNDNDSHDWGGDSGSW
ncbi:MAG: TPM domain-containing protein [archaeon]|nr:TPM domain-containing protein [archaeon]